ncbi:hypothetical protein HDU93_000567 [Gonapodya sp. JEL0774]|nr:hypothetical protein HDU93_000567 [Gonapodya sp. JEL0774]
MAFSARRQHLMIGFREGRIHMYQATSPDDARATADGIDVLEIWFSEETAHCDVVSCLVTLEGRFYSGGFDGKLIIYDTPSHSNALTQSPPPQKKMQSGHSLHYPSQTQMRVLHIVSNAHDAGITHMSVSLDAETTWLITGSFDKSVKLFSPDGNLLMRFDGMNTTVTGCCYVRATGTVWCAGDSPFPLVFEARSGVNVTDFVQGPHDPKILEMAGVVGSGQGPGSRLSSARLNGQSSATSRSSNSVGSGLGFKRLLYVEEGACIVGTAGRRLILWRFNPASSVSTLIAADAPVEAVTYTAKEPLLIFSAGGDSVVRKWERLQLNAFLYAQEPLTLPRELVVQDSGKDLGSYFATSSEVNEDFAKASSKGSRRSGLTRRRRKHSLLVGGSPPLTNLGHEKHQHSEQSKTDYLFNTHGWARAAARKQHPTCLTILYYEQMDILVAGYENGRVVVYGYSDDNLTRSSIASEMVDRGQALLSQSSRSGSADILRPPSGRDGVTNRVSGLTSRYFLQDHNDSVTGIVCATYAGGHWLVSVNA